MKKILLPLLLLTGLMSSSVKGDCDDYGAYLLNDQQWHTLSFISDYDNVDSKCHLSTIFIRQKTVNGDYEFKSDSESIMIEFYGFLTYWEDVDQITMEKTSDGGYEGSFYDSLFVAHVAKGDVGKVDYESEDNLIKK